MGQPVQAKRERSTKTPTHCLGSRGVSDWRIFLTNCTGGVVSLCDVRQALIVWLRCLTAIRMRGVLVLPPRTCGCSRKIICEVRGFLYYWIHSVLTDLFIVSAGARAEKSGSVFGNKYIQAVIFRSNRLLYRSSPVTEPLELRHLYSEVLAPFDR